MGLCLRVIVNANIIMGPPSELFVHAFGNVCKPGNSDSHIKKKKVHKTDDTIPTNKDPVYFMPAVLYPDHNIAKESSDPVLLAKVQISPIMLIPSTEYAPLGQFSATAVELSKNGNWMKPFSTEIELGC